MWNILCCPTGLVWIRAVGWRLCTVGDSKYPEKFLVLHEAQSGSTTGPGAAQLQGGANTFWKALLTLSSSPYQKNAYFVSAFGKIQPWKDEHAHAWNKPSQDYSMHTHERMWNCSLHSPAENDNATVTKNVFLWYKCHHFCQYKSWILTKKYNTI